MKMQSHFNLHSLLTFSEKTFSEKYSHILIFAVISYVLSIFFFCSLSRLSKIDVKIWNMSEKNLSVVYANDTVLRDVYLTDYFS